MPEIITAQEILPHPFRGSADPSSERIIPVTISIDRAVEVAADEYLLPFVTSDGSEDRHGSRIDPEGWDDSFYRQNPVVLWSHQTLVPAIGRAEKISRTKSRGTSLVRFAIDQWRAEGVGNLAMQVYQLCRDGFLNMGSESFIPKKWREMEATTIPSFFAENVFYERVEKTEFSIVNIGSNRNALAIRSMVQDGKISENEAGLLGLGMMLKFETPIVLSAPEPSKDEPAAADFSATREKIGEILRCCGCYPTYEEPEVVELTPEQKRAELDAMTEIVLSLTEAMNDALDAWRQTVRPEMRSYTSSIVLSCMFSIEWLLNRASEWYGETPTVAAPAMDLEEFERTIGNVELTDANLEIRIRTLLALPTRAGAVLNAKNRSRLEQIKSLADEVLASATKVEETDEEDRGGYFGQFDEETKRELLDLLARDRGVIRVVTPSDTETRIQITGIEENGNTPESQSFRIVAADPALSREAEASTPAERDLYRVLLSE